MNATEYTKLKEKIIAIREKLSRCIKKLETIKPEEKEKYANPEYRFWSGNIKDLEGFALRLEEWLNQPLIAEGKRYLLDLKKWSEPSEKISLEEIENEWRFISDNLKIIENIHNQIRNIEYESIKKEISTWCLRRSIEKDIEKAKNWAANAHEFATTLKQLENRKVESKLAEKVKEDSFNELLKITSFKEDNKYKIKQYEELINDAENIIKNKPVEVKEDSILNTYKKGKEIEERIHIIETEINKIKSLLIKLEWVDEDYNELWKDKQSAIKMEDLESIRNALEYTESKASKLKEHLREYSGRRLEKIKRMLESVKKENLKNEVITVEKELQSINWNKPDAKLLYEILAQIDNLEKQLQEALFEELKNEDAILLIQEPEIISDLGKNKGWDFDRFIEALKVVLRNGLIQIRAVKEK